jgi:hypothetical protein
MTAANAIIRGDNVSAPAARERPGADTTEVPVMRQQRNSLGQLLPVPPEEKVPAEERFWATT